ncbi:hypothetical protein BX666DRAFT_2003021 [Dichotomocladium elegans]|nr:hypothetical protein BX666DRAFT_2003021 [Dichotomocladium elegans]
MDAGFFIETGIIVESIIGAVVFLSKIMQQISQSTPRNGLLRLLYITACLFLGMRLKASCQVCYTFLILAITGQACYSC